MGTAPLWIGFNLFVLLALGLDLGLFHRKPHKIALKEAAAWTAIWVALALLFGLGIWRWQGQQRGLEFFAGYVIEQALSVDNLFVFLVLFRAFQVHDQVQHRVLQWGIIGALVMRGAMIAAGTALVTRFAWTLQFLGIFLVFAGGKLLLQRGEPVRYEKHFLFRFANKHLRVTKEYDDAKFFTHRAGKLFATPLFLVLLVVEISDLTFAVDSIPAIFGITRDAFLIYTSNAFAILGLRSLYFLLAGLLDYLRYLEIGLAAILIFIGAKMVVEPWWKISVAASLAVVGGLLLITVLASVLSGKKVETLEKD